MLTCIQMKLFDIDIIFLILQIVKIILTINNFINNLILYLIK